MGVNCSVTIICPSVWRFGYNPIPAYDDGADGNHDLDDIDIYRPFLKI